MLPYASQTSASIINNTAAVPHLPEYDLIGRDKELARIQQHLRNDKRVLITGEGGIGKSALAAVVADGYLTDENSSILWLWVADSQADELYESIARPFRQQQLIASLSNGARIQFLKHLLTKSSVRCIVLDDARGMTEVGELLEAIPHHIPLIITTRHANKSYDRPAIHLLALHLADSIMLLQTYIKSYSGQEVENNVEELCQLLAGNPYLIRIAAKTLHTKQVSLDVALEFISTATTPLVETVIELVVSALDEQARRVLLACGGFFTPDVSAELLTLYDVERPTITDAEMIAARARLSTSMTVDDAQLREFLAGYAVQNLDLTSRHVEDAMNTLQACGLVEIIPESEKHVLLYRLHDVIHTTLHQMSNEESIQQAVDSCLMLLRRHNEPQLVNFSTIRPLLKNMHKAAEWAMRTRHYADAERFAWDLYANSQFLDYRGYYAVAVQILTIAVVAAQQQHNPHNQAAHLRHLGMCYCDIGDELGAASAFKHASVLFHEIGDNKSEATTLAALGDTYRKLRFFDQAVETYQQALQISQELHDAWGQSKALANLGRSYRRMGQYDEAIHYIEESLAICRGIVDVGGESNMLRYLGNIYRETGDTQRAVEHYMAALTLVREIGDRKMEANILGNLGEVYNRLDQADRADEYYLQAFHLYADIEDRDGMIEMASKIAHLAFELKDYDRALHYFEKARALGSETGDIRQEAVSMWSMATVYEAAGNTTRAEVYFNEVQALYEAFELGAVRIEEK